MTDKLAEKVSFDLIRYANCWEDADVLLKGLNPKPGSKILSVGSAGDNSLSLLTTDPELVVAIDVNKIQLHLIELKKVSIQHLSYPDLLAFLGFLDADNRGETFNKISRHLSPEAQNYWEENIDTLNNGVITQGKFERYFQLFSGKLLPWIHPAKRTEELLKKKGAEAQKQFYNDRWNTWRWRLLFKIFFSKFMMGKYGRHPEFLREVKVNVANFIFQKAENHLKSIQSQSNFMLRYALTASFGDLLPHFLQPENYQKVKSNLNKLKIMEGYAEEAVEVYGTFNCMNLSNIFEYMNQELFAITGQKLIDSLEPNGRMAYWNLMVPRRISEIYPSVLAYQAELSDQLSAIDKGFFYSRFIIDQKVE